MSDLKIKEIHLMTITCIIAEGVLVAGIGARMCSVSLETVQPVSQCPMNKEDWKKRENEMKCREINQTCTIPSEFRYHCIRDSQGKLINVCAPLTTLKGRKCPEFNYGGEMIQEDNTATGTCIVCPFSYSSNELFLYSECLKTFDGTSTTLKSNIQTEDEKTYKTWVIAASIVCTAVVLILVIVVLVGRWNPAPKEDIKHNARIELCINVEELTAMLDTTDPYGLKLNKPDKVFNGYAEIEHEVIKTKEFLKLKDEKHPPVEQGIIGEKDAILPDPYYKGQLQRQKEAKNKKLDRKM